MLTALCNIIHPHHQAKCVAQNYMCTRFNGETLNQSQLILNEADWSISH